jgi:hypothetical protein
VAEDVIAALSVVVRRWRGWRSPGWSTPRWVRLSGRGRTAAELARVAEAVARSDTDLAAAMDRLSAADRLAGAGQLDEALSYDGDDPAEQAATTELRQPAEQVRQLLISHGLTVAGGDPGVAVQTNTGQIVQNTGMGTVSAPFRVDGNYTAGTDTSPPPPTDREPGSGWPGER